MKISTKRFSKLGTIAGIVILALNIAGCATKPKPPFEVKAPENGMIYGNIHIPGHEVTEIQVREYGKFYIPT